MFRKILIVAMFATAAGYCFAAENLPQQVVTSEVFYTEEVVPSVEQTAEYDASQYAVTDVAPVAVPVWPIAGSDADVEIACDDGACAGKSDDNIRIVSKIGADLVVENNFNLGADSTGYGGWSGGANMLHGTQIPAGFNDECNGAEMPLLNREMLEDDGASILTVSRSGRADCTQYRDGYDAFVAKMGMSEEELAAVNEEVAALDAEIAVDMSADAEPAPVLTDQVRSWVVANGQTLREVLQDWCNKEGWDLVWATSREYPIEASAVFKGRFVDVASALVRNFARATPIPYAKFYKGNRVLVVSTNEE